MPRSSVLGGSAALEPATVLDVDPADVEAGCGWIGDVVGDWPRLKLRLANKRLPTPPRLSTAVSTVNQQIISLINSRLFMLMPISGRNKPYSGQLK